MNIPQAIETNKTALARIVAGLFAMLGAAVLARIPLALHRSVARVLRPAESAARRLIVVLARITKLKAPPPRKSRPMPRGIARATQGNSRPSFQLFDPRRRFNRPPRQTTPRPVPRITFFGPFGAPRTVSFGPEKRKRKASDGLETSANLLSRLEALKAALDDLPRQARRLVRAVAKRENLPDLRFKMPVRLSRAPGWRQKPRMEIDAVLHDCDWLARNAVASDTS